MTYPDFNKGLIPAIVQDFYSKNILMLGYMNQDAFEQTINTKKVTFFSRSRKKIWIKGETSGNFLTLKSYNIDCDQDTILIQAIPTGPVCHKGADTCFHDTKNKSADLGFLEDLIQDRKLHPKAESYTNHLLSNLNKAAQKVGEEAVELIIEAKDQNQDLFLNEAADLMYHYLVLLAAKNFELDDVIDILKNRFN